MSAKTMIDMIKAETDPLEKLVLFNGVKELFHTLPYNTFILTLKEVHKHIKRDLVEVLYEFGKEERKEEWEAWCALQSESVEEKRNIRDLH